MRLHLPGANVIALVSLVAVSNQVHAQQPNSRSAVVSMEAIRPSFKGQPSGSLINAAYFAGVTINGQTTGVRLELPLAYSAGIETGSIATSTESGAVVGDPYVGVNMHQAGFSLEFGARLPIGGSNDAAVYGIFADIDRMDAFASKLTTLQASVKYQHPAERGPTWGLAVSPRLWVPKDDRYSETQVAMGYGVNVGYNGESVRTRLQLNGLADLSGDGADNAVHQGSISADFGRGSIRPGFYASVPVDADLKEVITASVGLTLRIQVR